MFYYSIITPELGVHFYCNNGGGGGGSGGGGEGGFGGVVCALFNRAENKYLDNREAN